MRPNPLIPTLTISDARTGCAYTSELEAVAIAAVVAVAGEGQWLNSLPSSADGTWRSG